MFYGASPEPEEEDSLQSTLAMIQDVAPTVQRLIAGLPPAEQAAVLRSKIIQMEQYASVPVIGTFARQRIAQYQARLTEVEKSAGYQRAIEKKVNLLYTLAIIVALGGTVLVGAKAIKELKKDT
tara:strand:- start:444 stop:815 length:372 start_codon:yes stop_codon:yes gene_type:complete